MGPPLDRNGERSSTRDEENLLCIHGLYCSKATVNIDNPMLYSYTRRKKYDKSRGGLRRDLPSANAGS